MQPKENTLNFPVLSLLGLIIFTAAINYLWLRMNGQPPVDDQAFHLISAQKYLSIFSNPSSHMLDRLAGVDRLYPPFFPVVAGMIAWVFRGTGTVLFCMTNVLFLAGSFFSLYFMGVKFGNRWSGVLASCFLSFYPLFFNLNRTFMLEIASVCIVVFILTLLLYSEGFYKTRISLLAGIFLGVGLLTKQLGALFIAGPAIFLFLRSFLDREATGKIKRSANFLLFIMMGVLIALPWYLFDFEKKYAVVKWAILRPEGVPEQWPIFSSNSLFYYAGIFPKWQVSNMFSWAFVISLIAGFWNGRKVGFLICWILVPFIALTFLPNKVLFYTLPSLPAVALVTALGFLSIKKHLLRKTVITCLLAAGFFQLIAFSFFAGETRSIVMHGAAYTPSINHYYLEEVVGCVQKGFPDRDLEVGVTNIDGNNPPKNIEKIGDNYLLVNALMWKYLAGAQKLDWHVVSIMEAYQHLLPSGGLPDVVLAADTLDKFSSRFALWKEYRLTDVFEMPDSTPVYLYKRKMGFSDSQQTEVIYHKKKPNTFETSLGALRFLLRDRVWRVYWKGEDITGYLPNFF